MTYFEKPGRENVNETLKLAKEKAIKLGIKNVVVASTRGFTAQKAFELFKDSEVTLTIVGIGRESFPSNLLGKMEEQGHSVCFSREVSYEYPELVKLAYRRFCEGVKVAVEIPMIAADAGLISTDEDVVSVGKWDTAMVIKPAKSDRFSDLRIEELICKPI
ncbi:MAG: hypothetical protein NWF14_01830 [Candidatus Bathyarchaeota archaeon]|nr:hypothetical protein [Candidatus Bathyarchaeota archaeon]